MLVKLAAEEMAAGKEVTYSYPKAEYDRAAMEYLGEPITQYETRKTTLTQDGNVESTGWGGNIPDFMVLTHLEQLGENHYKGFSPSTATAMGRAAIRLKPTRTAAIG